MHPVNSSNSSGTNTVQQTIRHIMYNVEAPPTKYTTNTRKSLHLRSYRPLVTLPTVTVNSDLRPWLREYIGEPACQISRSKVITSSTARSAKHQYLSYSEADFEVFRPEGATRCTDGGEIWHGVGRSPPPCKHGWGDQRSSSMPNFTPIGATIRV